MLNDLLRKLNITGSTDRISASGRPRSSPTHDNSKVVSSLNKAINQWLKFFLVELLKEDMLNNIVCTKTAFCRPRHTFLHPVT